MKFYRALLLQFIALSGFVYASSDSDKSREFYLCVKVKKNPVEQCSNKIFGKKDSLKLFTIAKAQVASSKPCCQPADSHVQTSSESGSFP